MRTKIAISLFMKFLTDYFDSAKKKKNMLHFSFAPVGSMSLILNVIECNLLFFRCYIRQWSWIIWSDKQSCTGWFRVKPCIQSVFHYFHYESGIWCFTPESDLTTVFSNTTSLCTTTAVPTGKILCQSGMKDSDRIWVVDLIFFWPHLC